MTKTLKLSGKMKTVSIAKPAQTIEQVLHDRFQSHVTSMVGAYVRGRVDLETRVRFIEFMGDNNVVGDLFTSMFYFIVTIPGAVDVSTVLAVAKGCDAFCTDDSAKERVGDYEYTLGDGDDGGAVQFENGQFRIWLRGRKFQ